MNRIDISKYLGIPFKHRGADWSGVDCYGLPRLFYKTEYGIEIIDPEYDDNWCTQGFDFIRKYYKENWIKIDGPERYCVVGFQMSGYSVEHHLGIILYDINTFLHSPLDKPVCVSKFSQPGWKRSISSFYRIRGSCQQS